MKRHPSIGIIGGAGPEAGSLLFNQMIQVCQQEFHCWHDYDFPLIHLVSYPFSEMLEGTPDHEAILNEVKSVFNNLQTDYVVIACNTLHCFLDETFDSPRFYHLIKETKEELTERPLLLCSSTSKRNQIHERFFACDYPKEQHEVDAIINSILEGNETEEVAADVAKIVSHYPNKQVVFGCTEFSVLHHNAPITCEGKIFIDPSAIAAKKLIHTLFNQG